MVLSQGGCVVPLKYAQDGWKLARTGARLARSTTPGTPSARMGPASRSKTAYDTYDATVSAVVEPLDRAWSPGARFAGLIGSAWDSAAPYPATPLPQIAQRGSGRIPRVHLRRVLPGSEHAALLPFPRMEAGHWQRPHQARDQRVLRAHR